MRSGVTDPVAGSEEEPATPPAAGGNGQVPGVEAPAPAQAPVGGTTQEGGSTSAPAPTQGVVTAPVEIAPTPVAVTVRASRAPAALPFTGSSSRTLLEAGAGMSLLGLLLALAGRRRRVEA